MTGDDTGGERTSTRPAEHDATCEPAKDADRTGATSLDRSADADADEAAAAFVDLEGRLDAAPDPGPGRTVGLVVDAATVPADRVPNGYPIEAGTGEALALTLDLGDGGETTAYLAWPADGTVDPESRLGRLLAATGVAPDAFADLYGRQLLVQRDGDHDTLYVPPTRPRGTGDWALGVAGCLVLNIAVLGLAALAAAGVPLGGLLPALAVPFLLINLTVLPWATYRDASYLRSHSDWDQGPLFWAALGAVPGLNVATSALYLRSRRRAWFLDAEPSLWTRTRRRVPFLGR